MATPTDTLLKELEELDKKRQEVLQKIEGEKPILHKDLDGIIARIKQEIKEALKKEAPELMCTPGGLHMTDVSALKEPIRITARDPCDCYPWNKAIKVSSP